MSYLHRPRPVSLCLLAALALAAAAAHPAADFIVVGGGTAGCTIAARLCTLLPSARVTLVERGSPRDADARFQSASPRSFYDAWANPSLTQAYASEPNAALENRTTTLLLGANLGGGSAVNGAQLLLPPRGTFSSWRIAGLNEARATTLFAFLRSRQLRTGVPGAPLTPAYAAEWLRAAAAAGLPFSPNPNAEPRRGAASFDTIVAFDQVSGRRFDAARTFLAPALAGPCSGRLRVVRAARAERVIFAGRRARGVEVVRAGGATETLLARREVLLAAGAIETAALLLRSGIGPAGPRRSLPVGCTLHSRGLVTVSSVYGAPLARGNDPAALVAPGARAAFTAGQGGVFGTSPSGPQARYGRAGFGGMTVAFAPPALGVPLILSYCAAQTSARSFGAVTLAPRRGDTAATPPRVSLRLLERAADVTRAARCVERMRAIHKQLAPLLSAAEVIPPGFTAEELDTREGVERKVRAEAGTAYHYVGTCAVGKVVDRKLRVFKTRRLRVVDSAAIPLLPPTAGPMAAVYIVALHAAELIAKEYKNLA